MLSIILSIIRQPPPKRSLRFEVRYPKHFLMRTGCTLLKFLKPQFTKRDREEI
jgi:hypothetical protein